MKAVLTILLLGVSTAKIVESRREDRGGNEQWAMLLLGCPAGSGDRRRR